MSSRNIPEQTLSGERLLTVGQALERLQLGRTTLWREVEAGEIKVVRHGRRVLIPVSQLDAWIERHLSAA